MNHFQNNAILISLICAIIGGCGLPPSAPLPVQTGSIRIVAQDMSRIDSITIFIDSVSIGKKKNPCTINDIVPGRHIVTVETEIGTDTSAFTMDSVYVYPNSRSDYAFVIGTPNPYPGGIAPKFTAIDVYDNPISLADYKEKIVVLIFFKNG